jgi:hypothetical protein
MRDETAKFELILYTRPGCHLCDVAAEILDACGISWRAQDIELDLDLIRRYGDRVPVLYRPGDGAELAWPFDQEMQRLSFKAAR